MTQNRSFTKKDLFIIITVAMLKSRKMANKKYTDCAKDNAISKKERWHLGNIGVEG